MKKTFSLILLIILIINIFIPVYAEQSGDYSYSILSDGTAEITSYAYPRYDTNLNIPSTLDNKNVFSRA